MTCDDEPIVLNIHGGTIYDGPGVLRAALDSRPTPPQTRQHTRQDNEDCLAVVRWLADAAAHAEDPHEMCERIYFAMTSPAARRIACRQTFRRVMLCVAEVARLTVAMRGGA